MDWFEERLHANWRQAHPRQGAAVPRADRLQDLVIFESFDWGRVLALDGVVQTTTGDEFCYHEMIVHVPMLAHGRAREVLIIGGGDGGCLREALKHPGVERVTQVEIDAGVIELCRRWLPSLERRRLRPSQGARGDRRRRALRRRVRRALRRRDRRFDRPAGPRRRAVHRPVLPRRPAPAEPRRDHGDPVRQPVDPAGGAGRHPGGAAGGWLRAGRLLSAGGPDLYRRRHGAGLRRPTLPPAAACRVRELRRGACPRGCATTHRTSTRPRSRIRPG